MLEGNLRVDSLSVVSFGVNDSQIERGGRDDFSELKIVDIVKYNRPS